MDGLDENLLITVVSSERKRKRKTNICITHSLMMYSVQCTVSSHHFVKINDNINDQQAVNDFR